MTSFVIEGGHPLSGIILPGGSKNAALKILPATLLFDERVELENIPHIVDIEVTLKLLTALGKTCQFKDNRLTIEGPLSDQDPDPAVTRQIRASLLLMGPLLARRGRVRLGYPGGDFIGHRPINAHLDALRALGASIDDSDDDLELTTSGLVGTEIVLPELSVTGTENALLAAVTAKGSTIIRLAATEPHVTDLVNFLGAAGAKITGVGTHTLRIEGVKKLHSPGRYRVMPDQIEAGTFAIAAAATGSEVSIGGITSDYLAVFLKKLEEVHVRCELDGSLDGPKEATLHIKKSSRISSTVEFKTQPHPGFPADLVAPWAVLMTQAQGSSLIHDPMFEGRQGYIKELQKMGADATILDPHRAVITGPTPLVGKVVTSLDLRAGATLIIAGLVAEGTTSIQKAEIIDRGYEAIDDKLRSLGADITRANE